MKKIILSILTLVAISTGVNAQIVTIPNASFKAYLVGNTAINTNGDTEIQVSEASAFTGTINCGNLYISNLTGIEAFTALTGLYCYNNHLSSLDVSNITTLEILECHGNLLGSINVSNNTNLTELYCYNNNLSSLDVSNNTVLTGLDCSNNLLYNLNVANGNNSNFTFFYANNSTLTCIQVDDVVYSTTNWTSIDAASSFSTNCGAPCTVNIPDTNFKAYLVGNTAINTNGDTEIQCSEASAYSGIISVGFYGISDMTGVEAFINLTELYCHSNSITSLDLSINTSLVRLNCSSNLITSLDVSNGNNTNFTFFNATNPNLTCIQVDDEVWSTANWTSISPGTSFSTDCSASCTVNIPNATFKAYLVGNVAINTNGDTEIQCSEASAYTGVINCPNLSISDLSGIEDFVAITELNCSYNSLSNLDISSNINLLKLYCGTNSISSLDVSNNTSLTHLHCNSNLLSSIDISNNTTLTKLNCDLNSISSLDVSNNTSLTDLSCSNNLLNSLVVSNNTNLVSFSCTDNLLSNLDVSNNTSIITFKCGNNALSSLDLSNLTSLSFISCHHNSLTSLNVANGNNSNVTNFIATDNPNLICVQVDDAAWSNTNWANPPFEFDATASFSTNCTTGGVGISESTGFNLNLYPNPVQDELFIDLEIQQITTINIVDLSGKPVKSIVRNVRNIDVSDLSQGVYILKVTTENGTVNKQFIKQ